MSITIDNPSKALDELAGVSTESRYFGLTCQSNPTNFDWLRFLETPVNQPETVIPVTWGLRNKNGEK